MIKGLLLPWPESDLSPNARICWQKRAKAAKNSRALGKLIALEAGWNGIYIPAGRIVLWIDFYPPTRRWPDDDNMLARFKPYRDGIADALGIDDQRFISRPQVQHEARRCGQVIVRLDGCGDRIAA